MGSRPASRRRFLAWGLALAGLGLVTACGRLPGSSVQPPSPRRIAYLTGGPPNPVTHPAFEAGLRDLGYVEGENLVVDWRVAADDSQLAEPAAELALNGTEVIVVPSTTVARVA